MMMDIVSPITCDRTTLPQHPKQILSRCPRKINSQIRIEGITHHDSFAHNRRFDRYFTGSHRGETIVNETSMSVTTVWCCGSSAVAGSGGVMRTMCWFGGVNTNLRQRIDIVSVPTVSRNVNVHACSHSQAASPHTPTAHSPTQLHIRTGTHTNPARSAREEGRL